MTAKCSTVPRRGAGSRVFSITSGVPEFERTAACIAADATRQALTPRSEPKSVYEKPSCGGPAPVPFLGIAALRAARLMSVHAFQTGSKASSWLLRVQLAQQSNSRLRCRAAGLALGLIRPRPRAMRRGCLHAVVLLRLEPFYFFPRQRTVLEASRALLDHDWLLDLLNNP